MKEIVAHILEIAVVVIALVAIIAIVSNMTKIGKDTDGDGKSDEGSGYITNQVEDTLGSVFQQTDDAINEGFGSAGEAGESGKN